MYENFIAELFSFGWLFGVFMSVASSMFLRIITIGELKSDVGRIISGDIYRRVMIEYRRMERERSWGFLTVLMGLMLFYIEYMSLLSQIPKVNLLLFFRGLIVPVLITFVGYLCYQKAFIKAMARAITEMDKVFTGMMDAPQK